MDRPKNNITSLYITKRYVILLVLVTAPGFVNQGVVSRPQGILHANYSLYGNDAVRLNVVVQRLPACGISGRGEYGSTAIQQLHGW